MSYHVIVIVGRNKSFSNQVLFALGWAGSIFAPTRTDLLNPTSERDASHPYVISTWSKEGCTIVCVYHSVCNHTHNGTPFLRPSAYKVRVGGISLWCGIEQIRAGGNKSWPCSSQSDSSIPTISNYNNSIFISFNILK